MQLILEKVTDLQIKERTQDKSEYANITFQGFTLENINNQTAKSESLKIKTNMSIKQLEQLSDKMGIELDEEEQTITTNKPLELEFEKNAMTKGDKPKPLFSLSSGTFNGYSYSHWKLHIGAFIENKIVDRDEFKKDLSKLASILGKKKG